MRFQSHSISPSPSQNFDFLYSQCCCRLSFMTKRTENCGLKRWIQNDQRHSLKSGLAADLVRKNHPTFSIKETKTTTKMKLIIAHLAFLASAVPAQLIGVCLFPRNFQKWFMTDKALSSDVTSTVSRRRASVSTKIGLSPVTW